MNYQPKPLKSNENEIVNEILYEKKRDFLSAVTSIVKFPINKKEDIQKLFKEVVNQIYKVISATKVSLNLKDRMGFRALTSKNDSKIIYVPINLNESNADICIGHIKVEKGRDQNIEPEEINFLETMAYVTGLKFQNSILELVLYEGLVQTLKVLVNTVEAKDVYTKFHSQRVAQYSLGIAEVMDLPKEERDTIKIAGILHDIGKIAIPESILLKRGKLTEEEFNVIKMHTTFGNEILKPLRFFPQERMIVLYHHERWDGSGYPEGLEGENIPLAARILAVADSFDAMTSDRVYRKARSFEDALKEIKDLAGIKYDPYVVNAFDFFLRKEYLR